MIKKILRFKLVSSLFLLSLVFVLGGVFWAYFSFAGVSGPLILHFNNLAAINQIGDLGNLLWVGATGVVFVAVNFFIAIELEERDGFLGKLLAAATLFLGLLFFVALAAIISVN